MPSLWCRSAAQFTSPASLLFEAEANQPGVPWLGLSGETAAEWLEQLET